MRSLVLFKTCFCKSRHPRSIGWPLVLLFFCHLASAAPTIRIGGLSTLEGNFATMGKEGMRGIQLALKEVNYRVAGKKIELIEASSDGNPQKALDKAQELIELHRIDILIGPLSGSEGLAIRDFAKTRPNITFVNGASGAQDTTLRDPAENFFRFNSDGAQWMAGLGQYVLEVKKYHTMATIAEDYSFAQTQVFGFMHDYCGHGGRVRKKLWVPLGQTDYGEVIQSIPPGVDAVFVALGGKDALNFLSQYYGAGMQKPLVGGSLMSDQVVLSSNAGFLKNLLKMPSAMPLAESNNNPAWKDFVQKYKHTFPDGLNSPSLVATLYYTHTKATLLALAAVNGDLSNGQKHFRHALAKLRFESPTGMVSLDENRQAITDVYVTEVTQAGNGKLYNKVIKVMPQVNQTLGMPRAAFLKLGKVGRDNPECQ
jgi:branched-chain amino acid transport system substrate-binding protein